MIFDVSTALTWILFIALFPISFVWLRRAWRIFKNKDYSEVALSGGYPPPNAKKYAPYTGFLNLAAGLSLVYAIFSIVVLAVPYQTWSAIAGSTIWLKLILDFVISRQARLFAKKQS
mgnify:CR=1 FL=1